MVEVIKTSEIRSSAEAQFGVPEIHIHLVERTVFGNAIAVKIWGDMKIAAKERVYARELKLNTLQVLLLTVEQGTHNLYAPSKWIYHKGELDNYASIDIFCVDTSAYEMLKNTKIATPAVPDLLPEDGSIWLNFIALGE